MRKQLQRQIQISLILCFSSLLLFQPQPSAAEVKSDQAATIIRLKPFNEAGIKFQQSYLYQLLDLVLSKTEQDYGPYIITAQTGPGLSQPRSLIELQRGNLSIVATMTNKQREEQFLPVYVPIYKGLIGYRVFLITKESANTFKKINQIDQLRHYSAGQVETWPDTTILRDAGLNVLGVTHYPSLFEMLKKQRIDYFPRSVVEVWKELSRFSNDELMVEDNLALYYKSPAYLFLHKDNKQLASRLNLGFKRAIADKSFEQLFNTHPMMQHAINRGRLNSRKIIHINNPFLSKKTPLDSSDYWLTFDNGKAPSSLD